MRIKLGAPIALILLAACGGSGGGGVMSTGNFEPSDIGDVTVASSLTATTESLTGALAIAGNGGFDYAATIDATQGVVFTTDLLPGTVEPEPGIGGDAVMSGKFGIARVTNAQEVAGVWSGTTEAIDGEITLTANFNAMTLSGSGDGLTVDGTINGNRLGGSVSYDGLSGILDGIIGSTSAIGLMTATGSGEGYAGGFAVAK